MMMKKLCLVFISVLQLCNVSAGAQTNDKAKEMAMKIAVFWRPPLMNLWIRKVGRPIHP